LTSRKGLTTVETTGNTPAPQLGNEKGHEGKKQRPWTGFVRPACGSTYWGAWDKETTNSAANRKKEGKRGRARKQAPATPVWDVVAGVGRVTCKRGEVLEFEKRMKRKQKGPT